MKTTQKIVIVIVILLSSICCDESGSCLCTLAGCLEGVGVNLVIENPEPKGFTIEEADKYSASCVVNNQVFENNFTVPMFNATETKLQIYIQDRELIDLRPETVHIRIKYEGEMIFEILDASLTWDTGVCNTCSGGSNCKDDMWYRAYYDVSIPIVDEQ